ncbi:MAG: large conductance mechanosensitive channel protein MscL [Oscillospiraceae bacterium]|nr:large conductance mechanosensitive channel protein MscL [Oscillospiraceae bacterium]
MKKFIEEFKTFIAKGNVLDMAVGVIIATAFGKITTSLVNDVFMPFIGWLIGDIDLTELNIVLSPEVLNEAGEVMTPAVVVAIGTFLSTVIDFILIAFVVFLIVKAFNTAKEKAEAKKKAEEAAAAAAAAAEPQPEPEPSDEVKLLMEIRDLLKK